MIAKHLRVQNRRCVLKMGTGSRVILVCAAIRRYFGVRRKLCTADDVPDRRKRR